MQKKCKKIWSCQKKAVLLHPLFEKQRSAWFPRDVNQRSVCGPKSVAQNVGVIERRGRESRGVLMQAVP